MPIDSSACPFVSLPERHNEEQHLENLRDVLHNRNVHQLQTPKTVTQFYKKNKRKQKHTNKIRENQVKILSSKKLRIKTEKHRYETWIKIKETVII